MNELMIDMMPAEEDDDLPCDDNGRRHRRRPAALASGRGLEARTIAAAGLLLLNLDSESEDDDLLSVALMAAAAAASEERTIKPKNDQKHRSRHRRRLRGHFPINLIGTLPLEFERYFHLTLVTFEHLCSKVAPLLPGDIPVHKQLMITLWLMSHHDSFKEVADRFSVCRRTAWNVLHNVVSVFIKVNQEERIISWPSIERSEAIARSFRDDYGVTDVIGVLDNRHIAIKVPDDEPQAYVNDHGFHSLQLQYVCDDQLTFLDVYIGDLGSVSCRTVLRRSPLFYRMDDDDLEQCSLVSFPSPDARILAGSVAYGAIHNRIQTPHDDNNVIDNARHVECQRRTTDRTFRLLTARCARLQFLDMSRLDLLVSFVAACCILHNLCVSLGDGAIDLDDDDDNDDIMDNDMGARPSSPLPVDLNATQAAT